MPVEVIEREVRVAASPQTVFQFFTDSTQYSQWKGQHATLDPRPGGMYRVELNGRDTARGEYLEVIPYSRVVFSWGFEGEGSPLPPGSSVVEVSLIPDGEGTIVRLMHRGLPGPQVVRQHTDGWDHYLSRQLIAAPGGDPGPDPWITSTTQPSNTQTSTTS